MNGWMDAMDGCYERMTGQQDEWIYGWMLWMDRWMDACYKQMDDVTDRWRMDGWIDEQVNDGWML